MSELLPNKPWLLPNTPDGIVGTVYIRLGPDAGLQLLAERATKHGMDQFHLCLGLHFSETTYPADK